ncbi:MAG: coenzyme F420-0:L-glutamate ligase [Candidatus Bathyarchaeia archaeon]
MIKVIGIEGIPIIKEGDDLAKILCEAASKQGSSIQDGDIIVITHVVVSRAEGNIVDLREVTPSEFAVNFAKEAGKEPSLVEVVLRESRSIVRMDREKLITETRHGFVCANAGVDRSNVHREHSVALLPKDPDSSARSIRKRIADLTGKDVAVIISDTHGRPFREGEINVAIGVSGLEPIRDRRGEKDLFGYELRVKRTAIADELASAAELVIGQSDEGIPAAIIRGYKYIKSEYGSVKQLIRPREKSLF